MGESGATPSSSLRMSVCSVMSDSLQPHGLTVARQAPLSMEFSRQEYWSELLFPPPGDLYASLWKLFEAFTIRRKDSRKLCHHRGVEIPFKGNLTSQESFKLLRAN